MKGAVLVRSGEQSCLVLFLIGTHKGETYRAGNMLNGAFELVAAAPLTAIASGVFLAHPEQAAQAEISLIKE